MANTTTIQIKRSTTDAYPSNVVFGELAFTSNGDVLYIGNESNTAIAIAGERNPGVLTANQAVVVNSTSFVDTFNTGSLTVTGAANVGALTVGGLEISGSANISGNVTLVTLTADDIVVSNTLTVNGDIVLRGDSLQLGDGGDIISLGASVNSHIIPTTSNSYSLGSNTSFWRRLFVKNIIQEADAPLDRKVNILWKKIGFDLATTDDINLKLAADETIISNNIVIPSEIWSQAENIPVSIPGSNTSYVTVYTYLECTEDTTATNNRTWKTNLTNWIPPKFGASYAVEVFIDDPSLSTTSGSETQIIGSAANKEWYFDYQAGVLHFIGTTLPAELTDSKSIYIAGARYIGTTGYNGIVLSSSELVNATITSLSSPLSVSEGGTGVREFTANSILAAANSSTLAFKTGSNGQVMLVSDNDVSFSDLDGGTY